MELIRKKYVEERETKKIKFIIDGFNNLEYKNFKEYESIMYKLYQIV